MPAPAPLQEILDSLDAERLSALLADSPVLASTHLGPMAGHPLGADPLSYLAMLRYDVIAGRWRDMPGTGSLARALLAAGAPVEGRPEDSETPLITAASYGDAEVAAVLIEAGADLEAMSTADAGGVPLASPLAHAAIFGVTEVVDVLVGAGAEVTSVVLAAAAGDISAWDLAGTTADDRILALIMAADHERLPVIDQLAAAGTPIDVPDPFWHRQALRLAASRGRARTVRHLLSLGADPSLTDEQGRTALDHCRAERATQAGTGYDEVEATLRAVSPPAGQG